MEVLQPTFNANSEKWNSEILQLLTNSQKINKKSKN